MNEKKLLRSNLDEIKGNIPKSFRGSITSYDVVKRKKFWGFTNNKM